MHLVASNPGPPHERAWYTHMCHSSVKIKSMILVNPAFYDKLAHAKNSVYQGAYLNKTLGRRLCSLFHQTPPPPPPPPPLNLLCWCNILMQPLIIFSPERLLGSVAVAVHGQSLKGCGRPGCQSTCHWWGEGGQCRHIYRPRKGPVYGGTPHKGHTSCSDTPSLVRTLRYVPTVLS